jgi:hypothetical protein
VILLRGLLHFNFCFVVSLFLKDREKNPTKKNVYFFVHVLLGSDQYSPHIFGQNYQNLPKVLNIIGHVLGTELIDSQTGERMIKIIKTIQQTIPSDTLRQALSLLPNEQQRKLQHAINART